MTSFSEIGLQQEYLQAIQEMGFEEPTPIQAQTIPYFLSNRQKDLIGLAQTGTGKTAAFGLPALNLTNAESKQTQTLILCPTRELCMQISGDLKDYSKYVKNISVVAVYGGASIDTQIRELRKGAQIVVATPGRAQDLIRRKKLQLDAVERVILDEADEMLSMGFQDDLDAILSETPAEKQTALFSATMSKAIRGISKKYMNNPVEISVSPANSAAEKLDHIYYVVKPHNRYEVLKRIADSNPDIYGIVFCRTRRETKDVAQSLMQDGYNADALHGDLSQAQRDEVMNRFRTKHLQMLVATDVAARGLDVDDLTHVINYNLPDNPEIYIHRGGRTGRAGKSGISVAVITPKEIGTIKQIQKKFGISFTPEKVPDGKEICNRQLFSLMDRIEQTHVKEEQIEPFLNDINEKFKDFSKEDLIKRVVSAEFNRFLAYYKNAKDINASASDKASKGKKNKKSRGTNSDFSELFINIGANNKVKPANLIGLVNEALRSGDSEIGRIEILKNFSFIEVEKETAGELIDKLNKTEYNGTSVFAEFSKNERAGKQGPKGKAPHKFKKNKKRKKKADFSY